MAEPENALGNSSDPIPVNDRLTRSGAPAAATFVMLGVIAVILLCLLALIMRLRHLARYPKREVTDLRALSHNDHDD